MLCVVGVIILIECCPLWIESIGESSMWSVEFIRKDEIIGSFGGGGWWCGGGRCG